MVLRHVGLLASELALPLTCFAIHLAFYISMLRQCILDKLHILQHDFVELNNCLTMLREIMVVEILKVVPEPFVAIVSG